MSDSRMHKLLWLTVLSPDILRAVLTGTLPPSVTLDQLLRAGRIPDWARQARYLGLRFDTASDREGLGRDPDHRTPVGLEPPEVVGSRDASRAAASLPSGEALAASTAAAVVRVT
ncbi:MAG: hypothetical protein AAF288_02350 [Planctomycetota bacterium]